MNYTFDTQLLSAAKLNQSPALLGESLSSVWYSGAPGDPTPVDVGVLSFAPNTVALLFSKTTVTQETSAVSLAIAPDGDDAEDTQATGTLTFASTASLVPGANQSFTINGQSWTYKVGPLSSLTTGQILLGADIESTIAYTVSAINGTDGYNVGSSYVVALSGVERIGVTSIVYDTPGNAYTTTSTLSSATWGASTLAGGGEGGGTLFNVAQAYHGSSFATLNTSGVVSIFTYTSAGSAQPTSTTSNQVTWPEKRRKWVLGF